MKNLLRTFLLFMAVHSQAQVLNVPEVIQEQDQWCWAGVSKATLNYYGVNQAQCDIAEYARQVITWYNFGTTNCCVDPTLGCNYWNYNYGYDGSIQDILVHFGSIQNYGSVSPLTQPEITTEITAGRPFIIRWGWYGGGGHFLVGHGINGNDIYYMNPWFGEGLHIATYSWLVDDGIEHSWTHTNLLTTNPSSIAEDLIQADIEIYPNPVEQMMFIRTDLNIDIARVYNSAGQIVLESSVFSDNEHDKVINLSGLESGNYFVELMLDGKPYMKKIIKG
jgi:hypothetical protein